MLLLTCTIHSQLWIGNHWSSRLHYFPAWAIWGASTSCGFWSEVSNARTFVILFWHLQIKQAVDLRLNTYILHNNKLDAYYHQVRKRTTSSCKVNINKLPSNSHPYCNEDKDRRSLFWMKSYRLLIHQQYKCLICLDDDWLRDQTKLTPICCNTLKM